MNKELRYVDYSGDSIEIEGWNDSCVVRDMSNDGVITVRTLDDAIALRDCLNQLIRKMTVEGSL